MYAEIIEITNKLAEFLGEGSGWLFGSFVVFFTVQWAYRLVRTVASIKMIKKPQKPQEVDKKLNKNKNFEKLLKSHIEEIDFMLLHRSKFLDYLANEPTLKLDKVAEPTIKQNGEEADGSI